MLAMFSIAPLDKGESVSEWVAPVMDLVDQSGLPYQVTPMATIIEGDLDQVLALIGACHRKMREHSRRVITSIKIDDREGVGDALTRKVRSVESRLGRELKK